MPTPNEVPEKPETNEHIKPDAKKEPEAVRYRTAAERALDDIFQACF